jgi:hypothetical protein
MTPENGSRTNSRNVVFSNVHQEMNNAQRNIGIMKWYDSSSRVKSWCLRGWFTTSMQHLESYSTDTIHIFLDHSVLIVTSFSVTSQR